MSAQALTPKKKTRESQIAVDVLYRARFLQEALDLLASGRIQDAVSSIGTAQRMLDWPCNQAIETGKWPDPGPAVRKAMQL